MGKQTESCTLPETFIFGWGSIFNEHLANLILYGLGIIGVFFTLSGIFLLFHRSPRHSGRGRRITAGLITVAGIFICIYWVNLYRSLQRIQHEIGRQAVAELVRHSEINMAPFNLDEILKSDAIPLDYSQIAKRLGIPMPELKNGMIACTSNHPGNKRLFPNDRPFEFYTVLTVRKISFPNTAECFMLAAYQEQNVRPCLFLLGDRGSVIKLHGFDEKNHATGPGQLQGIEVLPGNRYLLYENKQFRSESNPPMESGGRAFLLDLSKFTPDNHLFELTNQELRQDTVISIQTCGEANCPFSTLRVKGFRIVKEKKEDSWFLTADLIIKANRAVNIASPKAFHFRCDRLTDEGKYSNVTRAHYPARIALKSSYTLASEKEIIIPLITSQMMTVFSRGGERWRLWGTLNASDDNQCACRISIEFYH